MFFNRNVINFRAGHEDFTQVLEDKVNKPEQKINSKLEGQLKLHYCNKIKNSTDPYKKAVYISNFSSLVVSKYFLSLRFIALLLVVIPMNNIWR